MRRYRSEIFNRDYSFVGMYALSSQPTLITDYIVLDKSSISVPAKIIVSRGNYVIVKDPDGSQYQGIVTDYSYDKNTTTITLEPLMSVIDTTCYMDISLLSSMSIEAWLAKYIKQVFNGSDAYQNLTGLSVVYTTSTTGVIASQTTNNIYNLYDIALEFFRVYGLILDFAIDVTAKTFTITMRKVVSDNVWKLETNLADVINYSITAGDNTEKPNKITYLNTADLTQTITYYWHPTTFAGTIDTDASTNRMIPVRSEYKTAAAVEQQTDSSGNVTTAAKTFEEAAYEDAYSSMYRDRYGDLIEIQFNSSSQLLDIGKIGQLYQILDGDFSYYTILTGYQRLNDKHTQLTFGMIRVRLSQILKLDRRSMQ